MDGDEPVLTSEDRDALGAQRPPERFAERVMGEIAALRGGRGRLSGRWIGAGVAFVAAAAAVVVTVGVGRPPGRGEMRVEVRTDVRMGPHVIAVLEPHAHVAWTGDDVTQLEGNVFYRVEPGGTPRIHTPAGDVTVRGTCFDVKVRAATDPGVDMTRKDIVSGAVGAITSAAVLVGVYEGKVAFSSGHSSVALASGQGATGDGSGLRGPLDLGAAERAFEASSSADEPWRVANASLAEQVKAYQRRLDDNESQRKALEKELKQLKAKASADRDGGARDPVAVDPRDLTTADWKELAKQGRVRTKFFCPPPGDWHPTPEQLSDFGLAPGDAPAIEHALQATQDRAWQAVEPECTKMLGSADLAKRLGPEMCGMMIQMTAPKAVADADVQLVADIRAGNKPMPAPGQLNPLATRLLTLTGENASFERDLADALGPDAAHRIAHDDDALGIGCGLEFVQP